MRVLDLAEKAFRPQSRQDLRDLGLELRVLPPQFLEGTIGVLGLQALEDQFLHSVRIRVGGLRRHGSRFMVGRCSIMREMRDEVAHLVQEASAGVDPAADELLARFLPELRAFIRLRAGRRILRKESEEDLVQSVCREVLQDLSSFQYRGIPSFKKWLYLNALRKIYDRGKYYRREMRDADREESLPTDPQYLSGFGCMLTPSRAAIQAEAVAQLEAAFDRLPEDYVEVITLAKIVGLSHAEIAAEMGKTPNATRVLLHRALARLGRILEEDEA
jgi:RNA polymerase sigma-70 factor (ECF subfamily)